MSYTGVYAFFEKLLRNVQLDAAAYTDASGKHQRVRRCLNRWYYDTESGSANSFLVGSYGKDTEIAPPSDVDILFELPWEVHERFSRRTGNIQSQLLQEVKGVLQSVSPSTTMKADGQVILVPFTTYAVEVLPAFAWYDGTYRHADTNAGGRWRATNPVAEKDALVASNARTGGKTIHLVKLAKAWKAARNVNIKSFVLELAAVRFLDAWPDNVSQGRLTTLGYYDWMMRDFFGWLGRQTNEHWFLPGVCDTVATGDAWAAQARFAASAATRACEHHANNCPYSAEIEWERVFGSYVP